MAKLVDMVKRLDKRGEELRSGESFVAGCAIGALGVMPGVMAAGSAGSPTAVGGGIGTDAAESYRAAVVEALGLSDPTPAAFGFDGGRPIIVGLTGERLLLFAGSHLARPKALLGAWDRAECDVRVARAEDGSLLAPALGIGLGDDTWLIGDAPNRDYAAALAAAWED